MPTTERPEQAVARLCKSQPVRMTNDHGKVLEAEFSVEPDGNHVAIILQSRSGRAKGRAPRNDHYKPALELILRRLKERRAVIEAAIVDSRRTQQLPESSRSLISEPIRLIDVLDTGALRKRLTNAQTTIGQAPSARRPGNSTKRIRLRLSIPGYAPSDADRLGADLSAEPSFRTASEPENLPADLHELREAIRSFPGDPDGRRTAAYRREQAQLKRRLRNIGGKTCALCGRGLPPQFLVAAHIKKRSECTDAEKLDYDNVAMLACVLGCDSLYEHGFITVQLGGAIEISPQAALAPAVAAHCSTLFTSKATNWWSPQREPYFAWHRGHTFRRAP
ncbi:hypothetical protein ACQRWP_21955 [Micromonospora trifolii]|uniref:hypothetical protein n=1 Tax=Micromonospora trifolii TaxID=2911208 RepID=UPI003D2EDDA8